MDLETMLMNLGMYGSKDLPPLGKAVVILTKLVEEAGTQGNADKPSIQSIKILLDHCLKTRQALLAGVALVNHLDTKDPSPENANKLIQLMNDFKIKSVDARLHQKLPA